MTIQDAKKTKIGDNVKVQNLPGAHTVTAIEKDGPYINFTLENKQIYRHKFVSKI